jgi:hypothetical protein
MYRTGKASRAALLPTPCDPFILSLWTRCAARVWQHEVNKIYVCINTFIDKEVLDYCVEMFHKLQVPVEIIEVHQQWMDHGTAINTLLKHTQEQHIVLMEDDLFFLQPGSLGKLFLNVETKSCDAVVSPRGSCSEWITDTCYKLYRPVRQIGRELNFWPSLIIIDKSRLMETDCHFGPKQWNKGQVVPGLGTTPEEVQGDTFVNTSLQLRAKGLSFKYANQLRHIPDGGFSRYPEMLAEDLTYQKVPWVHIGCSSSGILGYLLDEKNI